MQIASYAKINLFLEVLAKQPDSYHQIETLLCSVSLYDTLKYALTKKQGIKLWSNQLEMVADNNLICQVGNCLLTKFRPDTGVEIHLHKRIPIAAGLGGGSSNAATTLLALNQLWDLKLSMDELENIASEFGSDIGFFLHGGAAWGTQRGNVISPCPDFDIDNILLVNPHIRIPSSQAYSLVRIPDRENRLSFEIGKWKECCFNRLEPGIRVAYPDVDAIIRKMQDMGAKPAMMSGSGSTCFGIFADKDKMILCKDEFEKRGHWTAMVRTITRNEYLNVFKA
jgi:4-diphosphocytidyl-2-C-methyl-D-erythritol kinase